jgi:superfamily I DNA/RNA helicase
LASQRSSLSPEQLPLSQESIQSIEEQQQRDRIEKENEILPPLPENAQPIREATLQRLSEQQLEVVKLACPPPNASDTKPGYIVRITAAAGTGKTTTLLHLAVRCLDLGHDNVTYVTFARASASDAKKRILEMIEMQGHEGGERITASTIHACAMALVNEEQDVDDVEKKLVDDNGLKSIIGKVFEKEIEDYIDPALRRMKAADDNNNESNEGSSRETKSNAKTWKQKVRTLKEQVVYYLYKSFLHFVHSTMTFEQYKDEKFFLRHYYPGKFQMLLLHLHVALEEKDANKFSFHFQVKMDFRKGEKAANLGFPPEIYALEKSYRFYADTTVKLWDYVIQNNVRTYDTEMKKAQLKGLRIPCSVLLVDECQDLDGCQVAFIEKQKEFGTYNLYLDAKEWNLMHLLAYSYHTSCSLLLILQRNTHIFRG